MILKPYIAKEVRVNSLLSESGNSQKNIQTVYNGGSLERMGYEPEEVKYGDTRKQRTAEQIECNQFLESEGRLLMLTTLYHERSLRNNKLIHDIWNVFACVYTWPVCECNFAKTIRGYDMGLSIDRIDYLRGIL